MLLLFKSSNNDWIAECFPVHHLDILIFLVWSEAAVTFMLSLKLLPVDDWFTACPEESHTIPLKMSSAAGAV